MKESRLFAFERAVCNVGGAICVAVWLFGPHDTRLWMGATLFYALGGLAILAEMNQNLRK